MGSEKVVKRLWPWPWSLFGNCLYFRVLKL